VAGLELRIQQREPATVLYLLVFLLLTVGFVSSGTVELVRDRGTLPKLSPLAIALAMGGLTAFGQVITTMITASAMLRDAAWRTDQLLFTTALEHRAWVLGRWGGALVVMVGVYAGLLAGVLLGAAAPWVTRDVPWLTVLGRALWPWLTVTLPTTLAVGTLLTATAVRTRRLLGVLAAALALLFLWQGCEALRRAVADAPQGDRWRVAAALADPFGTVAIQEVTASWTDAERAERLVPVTGLVGGSRVLWLALAAAVGGFTLRSPAWRGRTAPATVRGDAQGEATPRTADHARVVAARPTGGPSVGTRLGAIASFTMRWTWRETGWRVIAALGALNVFAHAIGGDVSGAIGVLLLGREHARLFLILLATIYAGELLWRDVDERVHELVGTSPVSTGTLVGGRVLGIMAAQAGLVAALVGAAGLALIVRGRLSLAPGALAVLVAGAAVWVWLPFVQWLVLSLAVHVAIRHKVMAHLALIAGWVAAVAFDANGVRAWWVRFADPPALGVDAAGTALQWSAAALRAAWWSTVSAGLFALTVLGWRRATSRR
jgi:hypothetical protein